MMAKSKFLVPSLVAAGLFFMALSWWMSTGLDSHAPGMRSLARIAYNSGEVFILHKSMTDKEELKKSKMLYYLDTVETGPNGDATLEIESGYRVRLLDNTMVTLDQDGEKAVLILKRGDVQFENFGTNNQLLVSKNGTRMTPNEYVSILKRDGTQGAFPELAPNAEDTPSATSSGTLSSDYIQDTLKRQIPAFDKCYKQLLQRTPGVVGETVLNFTIERTGKISNSDVSTSTIADNDFKRCLTEVVRRVNFNSFSGDPITSTFPMSFE
ncbi:MAG: AgmX/PglI C-terminal domain-containing protein [Bdellovibrionaceae bacterium]|nr:AgmX/PglI C-terminal domain-containing protein [Pseudobdellovibrionaceae bacterium]